MTWYIELTHIDATEIIFIDGQLMKAKNTAGPPEVCHHHSILHKIDKGKRFFEDFDYRTWIQGLYLVW